MQNFVCEPHDDDSLEPADGVELVFVDYRSLSGFRYHSANLEELFRVNAKAYRLYLRRRQQGIDLVLIQDTAQMGKYLLSNSNMFTGMSLVFRVVITAKDGRYKEAIERIRHITLDTPILVYVCFVMDMSC